MLNLQVIRSEIQQWAWTIYKCSQQDGRLALELKNIGMNGAMFVKHTKVAE